MDDRPATARDGRPAPDGASPPVWFTPADCDLDAFRALVGTRTALEDYPHADAVEQGVLVYGPRLASCATTAEGRRDVQAELVRALLTGPGVVVVRGAFDPAVVGRASAAFTAMLEEQRASGAVGGDHFAAPGANDRVWGALDKLAVRDPEVFVDYYGNDVLALVAEAWLGPGYQVTSQVNVVNPGGRAQTPHRDYHLGFMDRERAMAYPAHVHALSPVLTLQGAVAHVDMPVETGPTLYLPHSQKHPAGYVAVHDPAFTEHFRERCVQLPLATGDAAFFNPALFHGAGSNTTTDVRRMANLLQVSSAFGRAMETVDTTAAALAVHPVLRRRRAGGARERSLRNAVAAAAEGYPFPTDLDRDQPLGGPAPQSQAELLWQALVEDWDEERLRAALTAQQERRASAVR